MNSIDTALASLAAVLLFWGPLGCSGSPADTTVTNLATVGGPGSAQPRLARGADGTVVLSWVEPRDGRSALRFATLTGDPWSPPQTVAEGDDWFVNWADFPSIAPIDGPSWAAHWLVKRPGGTYAYDVAIALSADGGRTWSAPITPHKDGTATEHGFVSLYPVAGGVGALWLDGRNTVDGGGHGGGSGGMTLRSALISAEADIAQSSLVDDLVCDCCQTDVAVGKTGPVAVYRNRTPGEIRDIFITRLIDGAWETGRPLSNDGWEISGCPVNGPVIDADGQRVAAAWFTGANGKPAVRFARSDDGAASFGEITDVATDDPIGRVGLAMFDNGDALVSWMRQREDDAELVVRLMAADGSAGRAHVIARLAASRKSGVPQMVRHGNGVVLAWTHTGDDATQVWSVHYEPVR